MSLAKSMGAARKVPMARRPQDFYETDALATQALAKAERWRLRSFHRLWEPAAGKGAIVRELQRQGFQTFASDLIDRGAGLSFDIKDFLDYEHAAAGAVVTNPPYHSRLPERFVLHAQFLGIRYVALLLKSNYWHAKDRLALFSEWAPARYYPLTWRLDFTGEGSPTMDTTWFVWDRDAPAHLVMPLPKPVAA